MMILHAKNKYFSRLRLHFRTKLILKNFQIQLINFQLDILDIQEIIPHVKIRKKKYIYRINFVHLQKKKCFREN